MEDRLLKLEAEINRIRLDLLPVPWEPRQEIPDEESLPVELVVDRLYVHYREHVKYKENVPKRPLWHLVEDMQRQAMVYMNIIDQLKSGKDPTDIRTRFEELQLVPANSLPNPNGRRLLNWALDKIDRYREALVDLVKRHGRTLVLGDLNFARELTPTVELQIGFTPAVSIGVEFSGS